MNIYDNIVGGMWIHVEVLNIPWSNDLLDPTSHAFMMAKAILETDVSLVIQILISYKLQKISKLHTIYSLYCSLFYQA